MVDVFQVADLLISRATRTHGHEIDIIGYYGSRAQGAAGPESDLDIFYIPADGAKPPIARTFLVGGLLFDFWPIQWATMEGFATGRIRGWSAAPGIVHYAKVLYARSPEQTARLEALKQKVLDLQKPDARSEMVRRAIDSFPHVLAGLGNLRLAVATGDLVDTRHAGWQLIYASWECLALANQVFFGKGRRNLVEEASRLTHRPAGLEQMIVCISTSTNLDEINIAGEGLALETRQVLRQLQESLPCDLAASQRFASAYPEIKDQIGKLLKACRMKMPVEVSAAACFAQYDLSLMLGGLHNSVGYSDFNLYSECAGSYRKIGLPEFISHSGGDFDALAEQAKAFDQRIRQWLRNQAVNLEEYDTVADLEQSL